MSLRSWAAESVVGVPPPIYSVRTVRPEARSRSPVWAISRISASRYGSSRPEKRSMDELTKLQ